MKTVADVVVAAVVKLIQHHLVVKHLHPSCSYQDEAHRDCSQLHPSCDLGRAGILNHYLTFDSCIAGAVVAVVFGVVAVESTTGDC